MNYIKFFLVLALIFSVPNTVFSQEINLEKTTSFKVDEMSDEQVAAYWKALQDKGYQLSELESLAKLRGIPASEILKFKQRLSGLSSKDNSNSSDETVASQGNSSSFGHSGLNAKDFKRSNLFGFDFFSNPNITFAPNLNLATPSSYQLGPGDELLIDIWGAAENSYSERVGVDGAIRIENVGPVYVSGLSIDKAKSKITSYLSKIYRGVKAPKSSYSKVNVDISLINVRTVQVNIIGEVKVPGTYSISALSSVLNALYAAGGPTMSGTFRNIKIFRDGKQLAVFDVYKYLTKGSQEGNVLVRDQDIIIVDSYQNKVRVDGKVKRQGYYEFIPGETISDLINYFGGFKSDSYKDIISVERINGNQKEISEVNLNEDKNFILKDGDYFTVQEIIDRYENRVTIEGAVYRPGDFELTDGLTVLDLINKSAGIRDNAFLDRGIIQRTINDTEKEIISFSVSKVLNKTEVIKLKREDKIRIYSYNELKEEYTVSIDGAINNPQTIPFVENMQVEDLIVISGGYKEGADASTIDISRRANDGTFKTISENIRLSSTNELKSENNKAIFLKPFDRVSVRYIKGFTTQKSVSVEGEANYPGKYSLENKEERISDLLEKAGGLSPYSYVKGASLIRKSIDEVSESGQDKAIASLNKKQDSVKISIKGENRIGINLEEIIKNKNSKFDLILKEGDRLIIPSVKQTVEVQGEVLSPTVIRFDKSNSLKDYINNAGGFSENARKSKTYVVYANGDIKSTKKFLFFRSYPKLEPGALILVPHKSVVKNSLSIQEVIGITTSITTLGILINSLSK